MPKLNIGCGTDHLDGFINIDMEPKVDPDMVLDVRNTPLPYEAGSVDEVWMLHSLEHIEFASWHYVFSQIHGVLVPNGQLVIAFPEFEVISNLYLRDTAKRNFWRATLYGRQLYPSDYHVAPTHGPELKHILESYGFYRISYKLEPEPHAYDAVLVAHKDSNMLSREHLLTNEYQLAGVSKDLADL